jgi:hypothetical protein
MTSHRSSPDDMTAMDENRIATRTRRPIALSKQIWYHTRKQKRKDQTK